jgi:hypothetical protein
MTKFADQLFDDLMQEHGPELAATRMPAAPKRRVAHPVRLAAVAGGIAAVATGVGLMVPGGGTPAYAVTANANGTVTLDVYDQSGIAGANAALRKLGDQVVVVPVKAGCPSITSLPLVPRDAGYLPLQTNVTKSGGGSVTVSVPGGGKSVTVSGKGIPKGDVALVLVQPTSKGTLVWGEEGARCEGEHADQGSRPVVRERPRVHRQQHRPGQVVPELAERGIQGTCGPRREWRRGPRGDL